MDGQVKINREAALALVLAASLRQQVALPQTQSTTPDPLESPEAVALALAVADASDQVGRRSA